jgi:SH3-like domain-containing protein
MAKTVQRQAFVPLPLLRAIEQLPEMVEIDGMTLRFTGEVTSAPIVLGFSAYRAHCECDGHDGWVDLSSASTTRTDMTMRIKGLRARRVEQLVMALRAAMTATTARAEAIADERIDVCRTA